MQNILSNYKELSTQWNTYRDKGTKIANTLINKHLEIVYLDAHTVTPSLCNNLHLKYQLEKNLFQTLVDLYQKLYSCYSELKIISESFNRIPLTLTIMIVNYFLEIFLMYEKSLENKEVILNNILSIQDREELVVLISSWSHDIHINYTTIDQIEEMFNITSYG
ncbi:hypothetical protein DLAC_01240 [Tieghemostelium lacteum]|uniref:Uncharacterized protein n=1 Tax=Tieghemostelium lacteum TaxID=361077 RepID=A0A152A831_TIELA|nr:hypothetical protein DLAC_01240 [Tieghemostelium lacteum]|eukprot:KYR02400.1 hypothetical protein DLAC_01240 [Tieghemostelium lacteum]